ncbi:MAG: phenylalanine--tRNA ligase subunit beta [archaeon]|nr:phenylalanine--tRNA ligase subunit beta [archaeon]
MAIVTLNKKEIKKIIGNVSDEKIDETLSLFSTPIEKIGEEEIEVEVAPNRPDMLSAQGLQRALSSYLGKKTGLIDYKVKKPEKDFYVTIDKSVQDIRPYTACAIVKNLKFNDEKIKEIIDIQEKLHTTIGRKRKKLAIGIYPLEKIKLPITFKALEPDKIKFIPLESEREMSGLEILQRHSTGREYAHLLAGKTKFPIFIDANNQILSMPPIINSQLTGKITEDTKEIFIECSGFDFEILKKCINIVVTTLADMGGEIYQMELKYKNKEITPDLTPEKMKISIENTNKLLGLDLNEKQVKPLLEKMGYNYEKGIVSIPAWRVDILHEVDLIEDIAIAYGYDKFIPEIPKISTIGQEDMKETIKRKISDILTGLGFIEISNYHLTTKEDQFKKMNLEAKNFIEIENSKTDYNLLRKNLSHYLLKILSENVDSEYPQNIFEMGRIFNDIKEEESLAIAISPGNFTELKQKMEYLSRMMNLSLQVEEVESSAPWFIEGRVAEIKINNKKIGFIGEVHPKILKNWKLKMPVALLEINLEEIFEKLY